MSNVMTGANILVECLLREGVECLFGYPGGVTLPFYDVLYDAKVRHYLVRHEENAAFAAQGYARSTGKVGVCCATSGPGATNLVTGLVDALLDSIPVVAITGQVSTKLIGSDAFQEADTFGITRSCTKHNFLVQSAADLPRAIHEAFYIAASGRPGPVLVDVPKDVFIGSAHYEPVGTIHLPGYKFSSEGHAGQIRRAAEMMWDAQRPVVYAGGGVISAGASGSLRELVETVDAPAVCTLMGLGGLPSRHPNFISMPGMHGSYAANMALTHTDLIIALGVRFDDRVTGRLDAFAPHARVIHVDIEPSLRTQVIKQMNKLINVLQASDVTESLAVRREMALVRVRTTAGNRAGILRDAEIYGARVVDATGDGFGLECTGPVEKVEKFIDAIKTFGDIDVTRSGIVAVSMESRKLRPAPPVQACANGAGDRPDC